MPKFFLRHRNETNIQGPIDAGVVVEMAATGKIHPEDMLQVAGKADAPWCEAWRYRELYPPEVAVRYEAASNASKAKVLSPTRPLIRRKWVWTVTACVFIAVIGIGVYWSGVEASGRYSRAFWDQLKTSKEIDERAEKEERDLTEAEIRSQEDKVQVLEAAYRGLWPWQRDKAKADYVKMVRGTVDMQVYMITPPKMDANDPKGSFERFYNYYLGYSKLSRARRAAGADPDIGTPSFESWDVRKTDSLKNPIAGEAWGEWDSAKLGTYRITLNFVWRDSKWLTTTIATQWKGKEGYGQPDKDAAMRAVTRILLKLDLPSTSD